MAEKIIIYVLIAIAGFLIGSISPAIIVSHHIAKKDIRQFGSGNAGSTNMVRTFGWKAGLITFGLDILKGALVAYSAMCVGRAIGDTLGIAVMIGSLSVVAGHNWPVYYRFKGGKGVASTLGVLLVLMTYPTLGILAISVITILISGIVSIGSIIGMILCAVASFVFYDDLLLQITVCVLCLFSIFLHRPNIERLLKGTENKISLSKKNSN